MWRLLDVAEQKFMAYCNCAAENIQFILYNIVNNEGYYENISKEMLIQRSTQLNRRIKYPEDVVFKTITQNEPVQATLNTQTDDGRNILKLKYRVTNLPMHCEWHVERMQSAALWHSMLGTLLQTISGVSAQNDELRDFLRKKDIEIKQYKIEGAELRRSTVATAPFDAEHYDAEHVTINMQAKEYRNIAEYFMQSTNSAETCKVTNGNIKVEESNDKQKTPDNKKDSPRTRKRKAMETAHKYLELKIKQRRQVVQQLEYEDSQSQEYSEELPALITEDVAKPNSSAETPSISGLLKTVEKRENSRKDEDEINVVEYNTPKISTAEESIYTEICNQKHATTATKEAQTKIQLNELKPDVTKQSNSKTSNASKYTENLTASESEDNERVNNDSCAAPKNALKAISAEKPLQASITEHISDEFDYNKEMLEIQKTLDELEKLK